MVNKAFRALSIQKMCVILVLSVLHSPCALATKPNIVFILTDDHRYDMLSLYDRFPGIETPNIDRIATEGVLFENAFVTTSVCSPARASFLTGVYAYRHGVVVNAYKDPSAETPIFPALLQEAGYETAFIGKWHMLQNNEPRKGFDHWVSFKKQGRYFKNELNVDGRIVQSTRYITDELNDRALEFIERQHDKPFALYLSHKAIHSPHTPAPRHEGLYPGLEVPGFEDPGDDLASKPHWLSPQVASMQKNSQQASAARAGMLRTLAAVDGGVGRIFEALQEKNILDNTAIIFAGDNGYFFGEHGITKDKRKAYEPSIRIPLLMRYPPLIMAGSREDAMVLNIDLAPTLLALAGVAIPSSMQGSSWLSLFQGDRAWRDRFLYEYYSESEYRPIGGSGSTPTILAIRQVDWKYVSYPELENEIDELYDLKHDPEELHNLAVDPQHKEKLHEMQSMLASYLDDIAYSTPELSLYEQFCLRATTVCQGIIKVRQAF